MKSNDTVAASRITWPEVPTLTVPNVTLRTFSGRPKDKSDMRYTAR
jgi:hypothetical protein